MIVARAKVVIAGVLRTIAVIVVAGTEIVVVSGVIWPVMVPVVVPGVIWTVVVSVVTGPEIIVVTGVIWTVIVPVVVTGTEIVVGPRGSLFVVIVTEAVTASRAYVGVVISSASWPYGGVIPCLI